MRIPGCEDTIAAHIRTQSVFLPALSTLFTLILAPTHLSQMQVGQEVGEGQQKWDSMHSAKIY